jgi:hypothetical protein
MKNLHFLSVLLVFTILSCSSDNETTNNAPPDENFQAVINGNLYSNFTFDLGVYDITKNASNNTLTIDIADTSGNMITLFLNETGGFGTGTVKQMGNTDINNFRTFGLIRQPNPQVSYFSNSGSLTITNNREHPTEAGQRLISASFNITTASTDGINSATMTGTFTDFKYTN